MSITETSSYFPQADRSVGVVLLAAGLGERFGGETTKILTPACGESIASRCIRTIVGLGFIKELIVVIREEIRSEIARILQRVTLEVEGAHSIGIALREGGKTRSESVSMGLSEITADVVLIHDASRPVATPELFRKVASLADSGLGVVPAVVPSESVLMLKEDGSVGSYLNRGLLRLAQTPQGFLTEDYRNARDFLGSVALEFTDDGSLFLAAGYGILVVEGEPMNIKVTYPEDLELVEKLMEDER